MTSGTVAMAVSVFVAFSVSVLDVIIFKSLLALTTSLDSTRETSFVEYCRLMPRKEAS